MSTMDQWTVAVCAELGIEAGDADLRAVLDLTRDVAHGVARPGAPRPPHQVGGAGGRRPTQAGAPPRGAPLANGWDGTDDGTGD